MIVGRSLKGAEPCKQPPITETVINMTEISNLNTLMPVRPVEVTKSITILHYQYSYTSITCYFSFVIGKNYK